MPLPLIGPDGRRYAMGVTTPEAIAEMERLGYRVETPEAPQTSGESVSGTLADVGESAEAGAQGFLQGLSAGAVGAVQGAVLNAPQMVGEPDEVYQARRFRAEEKTRLAEEHPVATGLGDFAGMVLSPLGKLGTGGKAATALGRIGRGVLAGAEQGALYGAGHTVSDAMLGDHELTAESLIAGTGLGALLGGAGAGVGEGVAEGAKALVPRLGKALQAFQPELEKFASNKALKAAGMVKSDLKYLGEARALEVGKAMLERGHLGQGLEAPTAEGVLESIAKDREVVGKTIGEALDAAEKSGVKPNYAGLSQKLADFEAGLAPLERQSVQSEITKAREALAKYETKGAGFKELDAFKRNLQAKAKWSAAAEEFTQGLKRQLAGNVRSELDAQLTGALGSRGADFLEAKRVFGLLRDAERVATHGAERLGANAPFGLRDVGLGAAAFLHGGNPVTGLVSAIASKVWRERGDGVVARLAKTLADSPTTSALATSFAQRLGSITPALGRYAGILGAAAAQSPAHALATHMTLAQVDPGYAEVAQANGLAPDAAADTAGVIKAHGLAQLAGAVAAHEEELDRHVAAVLKGEKPPPGRAPNTQDFGAKRLRQADVHRQHVTEAQEMAANPEALVERLGTNLGNLGNVAPGVAAAMTGTANKAVQYLATASRNPGRAGPLAPEWHHTDTERHIYAQKREVVVDPMRALQHAAAGTLTPHHMEALRAVYPSFARKVSDKVLMAASGKTLPYRARLMASLLTGVDVDGTLGPAIVRNQAAIHGASGKPSEGQAATQKPGKGPDALRLASRTATPSQRREMQEEA